MTADDTFVSIARLHRELSASMHLRRRDDGLLDLVAVEPRQGSLPDCADLAGTLYQTITQARRAVLARLRRHRPGGNRITEPRRTPRPGASPGLGQE